MLPDIVILVLMGFDQVKKHRKNAQDRYTMNEERCSAHGSPGKGMMVPVIKEIGEQAEKSHPKRQYDEKVPDISRQKVFVGVFYIHRLC